MLALIVAARFVSAQSSDSPKLTEDFVFRLGHAREHVIDKLVETMMQESDSRQTMELHEANQGAIDRLHDLTRAVPFKLSGSDIDSDGFLTPNYLRLDYAPLPRDPHFLNGK